MDEFRLSPRVIKRFAVLAAIPLGVTIGILQPVRADTVVKAGDGDAPASLAQLLRKGWNTTTPSVDQKLPAAEPGSYMVDQPLQTQTSDEKDVEFDGTLAQLIRGGNEKSNIGTLDAPVRGVADATMPSPVSLPSRLNSSSDKPVLASDLIAPRRRRTEEEFNWPASQRTSPSDKATAKNVQTMRSLAELLSLRSQQPAQTTRPGRSEQPIRTRMIDLDPWSTQDRSSSRKSLRQRTNQSSNPIGVESRAVRDSQSMIIERETSGGRSESAPRIAAEIAERTRRQPSPVQHSSAKPITVLSQLKLLISRIRLE